MGFFVFVLIVSDTVQGDPFLFPCLLIGTIILGSVNVWLLYTFIDFMNPDWGKYRGITSVRQELTLGGDVHSIFRSIKIWLKENDFKIKKENLDSHLKAFTGLPYGTEKLRWSDGDQRRWLEVSLAQNPMGIYVIIFEKVGRLGMMRGDLIEREVSELIYYLRSRFR